MRRAYGVELWAIDCAPGKPCKKAQILWHSSSTHQLNLKKKKNNSKIATIFHKRSTLYTFMPTHTVHWKKGRDKVPTACNRSLNPLTNLGCNAKSRCCRAQKQTMLYGSAGSNTRFTHCTFYFASFLEGTIELVRFSKRSQKIWQGINRNRVSFHEIISPAFYMYIHFLAWK